MSEKAHECSCEKITPYDILTILRDAGIPREWQRYGEVLLYDRGVNGKLAKIEISEECLILGLPQEDQLIVNIFDNHFGLHNAEYNTGEDEYPLEYTWHI